MAISGIYIIFIIILITSSQSFLGGVITHANACAQNTLVKDSSDCRQEDIKERVEHKNDYQCLVLHNVQKSFKLLCNSILNFFNGSILVNV